MPRIDVHWRYINFHFWRKFLEIEAADAMRRESQASFKFRRNPLGVFSDFQVEFFRTHHDPRRLRSRLRPNFEGHPQFRASFLRQWTIRPRNVGTANTVLALDRHADTTFAKLVVGSASRAQAKCALAALQVGNAHPGKQHALKFLRRKCDRNANHGTENSRLAQPVPERRALPHPLDLRLAERNRILANLDMPLRSLDLSRRKKWKIVAGVACQEVVNIVLARIHP